MRKVVIALVAAATLASAVTILPGEAEARRRGAAVAAGVIGGLAAGALIAGAAGAGPYYAPPPAYYAPGPVYYGPSCRIVRERYWDGYGWRHRRVEVC